MCMCGVGTGGCSIALGNARTELRGGGDGGGWSSHCCALCKCTALAPAGKVCSRLQHQSLHAGPATLSSLIGHAGPRSLYCPCQVTGMKSWVTARVWDVRKNGRKMVEPSLSSVPQEDLILYATTPASKAHAAFTAHPGW